MQYASFVIMSCNAVLMFQALTKFLKCVNWNQPQETKQALELLSNWNPMDVEDALELLSPTFSHPSVRKYAVSRLRQADDEVINIFALNILAARPQ